MRRTMNRLEALKMVKKKRSLGVRDFWYFDLEDMVKDSLLHKTYPVKGRAPGWPVYIITKKGLKLLAKEREKQRRGQA